MRYSVAQGGDRQRGEFGLGGNEGQGQVCCQRLDLPGRGVGDAHGTDLAGPVRRQQRLADLGRVGQDVQSVDLPKRHMIEPYAGQRGVNG